MDDDERTDEELTEVTAPPAGLGDDPPEVLERTFTQAEVDALIKERLKRVKRRRPKPKAQPSDTAEQTSDAEPEDGRTPWQLRDDFDDATGSIGWANTKQKRWARDKFIADKPTDPDAWADDLQEILGSVTRTAIQETDNTTADDGTAAPTDPPVSDAGAPATIPDYDTMIDPNGLTADDIRRMVQKYGKAEADRKIRTMAQSWYRGRPIVHKKKGR